MSDRLKPKAENIPEGTPYFAGEHIEDHWVEYPWEQTDIRRHVSCQFIQSIDSKLHMLTSYPLFNFQDEMAFGEPTRVEPTQHFFGEA